MIHKPIQIKNLSLSFPHKTCFEDFNIQIHHGNRIAIIGRNGCGKSTLLRILQGAFEPRQGDVKIADDVVFGYVPQVIDDFNSLSGGQRLNEAMTHALRVKPNVLLLDEPTNHLDHRNRTSLMRMLRAYTGTLIVVSHDTELLRHCIDTLWHIDNGKLHVFSGHYDDYIGEIRNQRASTEQEIAHLARQKKDMHHRLMKEQSRAAKSKTQGAKSIEQRKWPTVVSHAKAGRAQETSGCKKSAIDHKKSVLSEQLSNLRLPDVIVPKFSLNAANIGTQTLVSISNGTVGYPGQKPLLHNISLSLGSRGRIAIHGDNGSGKSTLIKAIMDNADVIKSGHWYAPKIQDMGYLDQHYATLSGEKSVLETITAIDPSLTHAEIRRHLNDFLFRKNEEVNAQVHQLSGGEKARLSLAQIAVKTPKLLILDEITNNLDLETRQHVIEVLKVFPSAMIIISHDQDFLKEIEVTDGYQITEGYFSFST